MRQVFISASLLLAGQASLSGQVNLVSNPSFEIISSCPTFGSQLSLANNWISPLLTTPDYFNSCCSCTVGVPSNNRGNQNAFSGNAYGGFITYGPGVPDYRELVEGKLVSPLIAGAKYCISFYVSLAGKSMYATDLIGAYFSSAPIIDNISGNLSYLTPQFESQPGNIFTDSTNWILVSGSYTASGGEQFITIGNFHTDPNIQVTNMSGSSPVAYYYIDEVSVTYCDSLVIPNVFSPNNDGINDVFAITSPNLKDFKLDVYNRWGTLVYSFLSPHDAWDGHNTTGEACEEGTYFYILSAKGDDDKSYSERGFIQLLK